MIRKPAKTLKGYDLLGRLDPEGKTLGLRHVETLSLIARHATSYIHNQVADCNGPGDYVNRIPYPEAGKIYERHQVAVEKKRERLERRITELVAELGPGYGVEFSGDPRGACVYIKTPDGRSDDWGGRGVPAVTH